MKLPTLLLAASLAAAPALALAEAPTTAPATRPAAAERPRIEVCFVLDTTGSMGGLIDGAKAKIWSIANAIVRQDPVPDLKVGLLAYRDRGDAYVTQQLDLTDDLDKVFAKLQTFQADGGGDGPESVNQALDEAVKKIAWGKEKGVTRIIFLVGDAPPHMDYKDDAKYPAVCKAAAADGILVNAVQCGSEADTTPVWKEIAKLTGGAFIQLPQSGGVEVVAAPQDKELAELNQQVGRTMLAYGDTADAAAGGGQSLFSGGRMTVDKNEATLKAKQAAAESAAPAAAADRLAYNAASGGKVVQGEGELLDAIKAKRVKLADLKDDQLPESLRKLKPEQRAAKVAELQTERDALQAKIATLSRQRQAYLDEQAKKSGAGPDAFDKEVAKVVQEQAAK